MITKKKTIGIWGMGKVGKAVSAYLLEAGYTVLVFDQDSSKQLTAPSARSLEHLFEESFYLMPSPGIDTRQYRKAFTGIWLCELDLFQHFFHKKIIAITGSVGKTTITHLLSQTLNAAGLKTKAAGNIGLPMFDVLCMQDELDVVLLELSSFQLEFAQTFSPDLAVWSNFYPNHLDRHGNLRDYFLAKYNLIKRQPSSQVAIIPFDLKQEIKQMKPTSTIVYFNSSEKLAIKRQGFHANWVVIEKVHNILDIPMPGNLRLDTLEHRLEPVGKYNGVSVINDSKSTTPASTIAAIKQLHYQKITLLLGGLSKGIDRKQFIQKLVQKNVQIICFGRESIQLHAFATSASIKSAHANTLSEAIQIAISITEPASCILLSPAGSSFDEFKNYEERGKFFKQAIKRAFSKTD